MASGVTLSLLSSNVGFYAASSTHLHCIRADQFPSMQTIFAYSAKLYCINYLTPHFGVKAIGTGVSLVS